MELLIIGIVTALNLIIIIKKVKLKRYEDAVLDSALFVLVVALFSGSYAGMVVSMIASMTISLYLLVNPPNFLKGKVLNKENKASMNKAKSWIVSEWEDFDLTKDPNRRRR